MNLTAFTLGSSIYQLTDKEIRFFKSFGTPEKPIFLSEFLEFWNNLDEFEQDDYRRDYWGY